MEKLSSKDIIRVPKHVTCFYCNDRSFLLVKGKLGVKLLKLELKVELLMQEKVILVTKDLFFIRVSKNMRYNIKGLHSKTKTLIKKALLDVSRRSYKKLKLMGVGFRISSVLFKGLKLLKLNVGYSHSIYYRIPEDILVSIISSTRFIVSGTSSDRVGEVSSIIRQFKVPESYKGKGILYEDEEILLKKVKKS